MQVFHTAGVPPNVGKTILANMGWIRKRRLALTNKAMANNMSSKRFPPVSLLRDLFNWETQEGAVPCVQIGRCGRCRRCL